MPEPMAPACAGVLAKEMTSSARPPATPAADQRQQDDRVEPAPVDAEEQTAGDRAARRPATKTVEEHGANLPPMIVPCRVGVVNRRGSVPSRSSVRIVRATLEAPKNMKKIIMPARIWPVTLTFLLRLAGLRGALAELQAGGRRRPRG